MTCDGEHLAACLQHRMVGSVEFAEDGQIRHIWVDSQHRRQGLARLMLTEVERRTGHVVYPLPPVSELARSLFS